jgi:hypothetical protein
MKRPAILTALCSALLLLLVTASASAKDKSVYYTATAEFTGGEEWTAGGCGYGSSPISKYYEGTTSSATWTYHATYKRFELGFGEDLRVKNRTPEGSYTWSWDSCMGTDESGSCPIVPAPDIEGLGTEITGTDGYFDKERGKKNLIRLVFDPLAGAVGIPPGCPVTDRTTGVWFCFEASVCPDEILPHATFPLKRIGRRTIRLRISDTGTAAPNGYGTGTSRIDGEVVLKRVGNG